MCSNISKAHKILAAIFFALFALATAVVVAIALPGCDANVEFQMELNINKKKANTDDEAIVPCPIAPEVEHQQWRSLPYEKCIGRLTSMREEKRKMLDDLGCAISYYTMQTHYDFPESHQAVILRVVGQIWQLNKNFQECSPLLNGLRWLYEQKILPFVWHAESWLEYWWYWEGGNEIVDFIMVPVDAVQDWIFRKEQLRSARENLAMLLKATACEDMLCVILRAEAISNINIGLYANSLNASDIGASPAMLIKEWQKIVRLAYVLWVRNGMPEATDDDSMAAYLCDFVLNAGNSFTVDIHDHGLSKAEVETLNCELQDWGDTVLLHRSHKSNPFNHRRPRR